MPISNKTRAYMSDPFLNRSRHNTPDQRHICIVTETYAPEINGVALTLARLVEGLRLQGHTVSLIRPRQRRGEANGRGEHSMETLVPGLPLFGYKGLHFGLPAGEVLLRQDAGWKPALRDFLHKPASALQACSRKSAYPCAAVLRYPATQVFPAKCRRRRRRKG